MPYVGHGGVSQQFETTPLLTAKEAEAAMKQAHDAKVDYPAPNASSNYPVIARSAATRAISMELCAHIMMGIAASLHSSQ